MSNYTYTPTPQFQTLLNTKTKEEILHIFLEHLKSTHPIPEDVVTSLTFSNKIRKSTRKYSKGDKWLAIVEKDRDKRTADITLYGVSTETIQSLLSSIAHEYKHILQAFVDNTSKWGTGFKDFDVKLEVEAGIFGVFQSRMFCYGW